MRLRVQWRRPWRKFLVEVLWSKRPTEPTVLSQPGARPQGFSSHLFSWFCDLGLATPPLRALISSFFGIRKSSSWYLGVTSCCL